MRFFDLRLRTVVRPQGKHNCSLCCITGACRFLFNMPDLLVEDVARMLGMLEIVDSPKLGSLATNEQLMTWFSQCCKCLGHTGVGEVIVEPRRDPCKPAKRTSKDAEQVVASVAGALSSSKQYVVYHMLNHYAPVVGMLSHNNPECSTLVVGESVPTLPAAYYIPLKEILLDLSLDLPEYINPRASRSPWRIRIWPGIVTENIHALLCFRVLK